MEFPAPGDLGNIFEDDPRVGGRTGRPRDAAGRYSRKYRGCRVTTALHPGDLHLLNYRFSIPGSERQLRLFFGFALLSLLEAISVFWPRRLPVLTPVHWICSLEIKVQGTEVVWLGHVWRRGANDANGPSRSPRGGAALDMTVDDLLGRESFLFQMLPSGSMTGSSWGHEPSRSALSVE